MPNSVDMFANVHTAEQFAATLLGDELKLQKANPASNDFVYSIFDTIRRLPENERSKALTTWISSDIGEACASSLATYGPRLIKYSLPEEERLAALTTWMTSKAGAISAKKSPGATSFWVFIALHSVPIQEQPTALERWLSSESGKMCATQAPTETSKDINILVRSWPSDHSLQKEIVRVRAQNSEIPEDHDPNGVLIIVPGTDNALISLDYKRTTVRELSEFWKSGSPKGTPSRHCPKTRAYLARGLLDLSMIFKNSGDLDTARVCTRDAWAISRGRHTTPAPLMATAG